MLMALPAVPLARHVRPVLFGGVQRFFLTLRPSRLKKAHTA
jgi:hypothetical protein